MKSRILSIFLLLFAFFPLHVLAQDECVAATGEPLIIGAVFPTQSLLTARGNVSYQGAETMRQAVNACGGVNGRPVEWQIVSAQDRYDSADAALSLADAGLPLIVGSGSTAVSEGARDVAEANNIVYWEVSESIEQSSEWIFSPRPSNYQMGQQAAQFIEAQFPDARVALVYEDIPLAQTIASGVRDTLTNPPLIDEAYDIYNTYELASRMRDEDLSAIILISFDAEAYYLWYDAREADANLDAWLHIGSEGYWYNLCARAQNIEGFMSLSPFAAASEEYRDAAIGEIDTLYRELYEQSYDEDAPLEANLSASGVYLLLRYVLPNIEGELTAENVRAAIQSLDIHDSIGLMGEGLAFEGGLNVASVAPVRQQQDGRFCSVYPSAIATCVRSVESFPTWRARAIEVDSMARCGER
jgi:hypothetical protein